MSRTPSKTKNARMQKDASSIRTGQPVVNLDDWDAHSDADLETALAALRDGFARISAGNKITQLMGGSMASALEWSIPPIRRSEEAGWFRPLIAWHADRNKKRTKRTKRMLPESSGMEEAATNWLETHGENRDCTAVALARLEELAWCYNLPHMLDTLTPRTWFAIFDALREIAMDSPLSSRESDDSLDALQRETAWYRIELALAMAWQFPQSQSCQELRKPAVQRARHLFASQVHQTDDSLSTISHIRLLARVVASSTRCLTMLKTLPKGSLGKNAKRNFRKMVRRLMQGLRSDGQFIFTGNDRTASGKERGDSAADNASPFFTADTRRRARIAMLETALRLVQDDEGVAMLRSRLRGKRVARSRLPDPSSHHEPAHLATLQSDWKQRGVRLAVDYRSAALRAELEVAGSLLLLSDWTTDIVIDGCRLQPVDGADAWSCLCWFSDEDMDLLELELALEGGWVLQRQFLLGRSDRFFVTNDFLLQRPAATTPDKMVTIEYRLRVPLGEELEAREKADARELLLSHRLGPEHSDCETLYRQAETMTSPGGKMKKRKKKDREATVASEATAQWPMALALPLALPEWREDQGDGEFSAWDAGFELRQKARGRRMGASIFFDLNESRIGAPRTWRQLTVAQTRRIVATDEALGFRVQIGANQWLMYASLAPPANRTVLGKNLVSQFLFARLTMDGEVETLVSLES